MWRISELFTMRLALITFAVEFDGWTVSALPRCLLQRVHQSADKNVVLGGRISGDGFEVTIRRTYLQLVRPRYNFVHNRRRLVSNATGR